MLLHKRRLSIVESFHVFYTRHASGCSHRSPSTSPCSVSGSRGISRTRYPHLLALKRVPLPGKYRVGGHSVDDSVLSSYRVITSPIRHLSRTADTAMTRDNANSHQAPKRRKVAESCKLCRAKKTRCDGQHPACSSCTAKGLQCEYNPATFPVSNDILGGIESRLRKLEQQVSSPPAHAIGPEQSGKSRQ